MDHAALQPSKCLIALKIKKTTLFNVAKQSLDDLSPTSFNQILWYILISLRKLLLCLQILSILSWMYFPFFSNSFFKSQL